MKRRCLDLSESVDIIQRSEKGESARSIALKLSIGKMQIQNVQKERHDYGELFLRLCRQHENLMSLW